MNKVCRTCGQVISTNDYFYLEGVSYVSDTLTLKDLVLDCVPEFDVNFIENSLICRNCTSTLHIVYEFKQTIIQTEKANFNENTKDDIKVEFESEEISDSATEIQEIDELSGNTDIMMQCPPLIPILRPQSSSVSPGKRSVGSISSLHEDQNLLFFTENIKVIDCPPLVPFDHRLQLRESNNTFQVNNLKTYNCSENVTSPNRAGAISEVPINPGPCSTQSTMNNEQIFLTATNMMEDRCEFGKIYRCKVCNKQFKTKRGIWYHSMLHLDTPLNFKSTYK